MTNEARKKLRTWAPTLTFGIVLYALLTNPTMSANVYRQALRILNPLIIGASIALVLNVPLRGCDKLIRRLDKKGRLSEKATHTISLVAVFVLTPLAIAGIVAFFVPQFAAAVSNLIAIIRDNNEEIISYTSRIGIDADVVNQKIDELVLWITNNLGNIAGVTISTVISIMSSVTSGIMGVMLSVYLLISRKRLLSQGPRVVGAILPPRYARGLIRVCQMFVDAFSRFLSRQFLEAFILGAILFIGMSIFRVPYAMSVCCLSMVLALIPYVGAFLSMIIGALMIVLVDPSKALMFLIIFLVVQQIEENLIYPHVVGESVGLPAYITLLAVAVGSEVMGIAGMMLFVPIASVAYTLAREFVHRRNPPLPGTDKESPC